MTQPDDRTGAPPGLAWSAHRRLSIRIADVALGISSDCGIVHRDPRRSYGAFLVAEEVALSTKAAVRLRLGEGPVLDAPSRVFDSGNLWSVYADDRRRRLIAYRDPNLQPTHVWTAALDPEEPSAEVFCTPHCLRDNDGSPAIVNPVVFPLDQIFCMYILAARGGLILHSCGFETAGRGIVLAGRSGAGKTTSARFLEPRGDVTVFSDDRTIVRRSDAGWRVHGTPWPGDAGIARQASAPLSSLVFLTKADRNAIVPIEKADALRRLLIVTSVPWYDADYMTPILDTADRLLAEVPCYEFRFRNDASAADEVVAFARSLPLDPRLSHPAPAPV